LEETISALSALYPSARSAALVPVGLTRFREGLAPLTPYDAASAAALLAQAHACQARLLAKHGTRFVFPADEFYCLADVPLPEDTAYETYPQIENGVGLLRSFETEFVAATRYLAEDPVHARRVLIATGTSAAPFFRRLLTEHPIPGVDVRVLPIPNTFFGPSVTVAGLLTGGDLIEAVRGAIAALPADEVLFSRAMLRREGDLFLDDLPLSSLADRLPIPARPVDCDGGAFYDALCGAEHEGD